MTAAQGRPCLQGLEWSSICGPEAGSVPTVPWQENVQPSQPRQLGNSQGAMENWRATVPCWSWGSFQEESHEGVMSQEQGVLYYFGTTRTWHLVCLMSKTKPQLVMRASRLCWLVVIKFIIWQVCLEGAEALLTIFTQSEGVRKCRLLNNLHWRWWISKNWNWITTTGTTKQYDPLWFMTTTTKHSRMMRFFQHMPFALHDWASFRLHGTLSPDKPLWHSDFQ